MSEIPCAVVGVGQTHHKSRRLRRLLRRPRARGRLPALDDAHMTMADIDAVVLGKAPDLFEGVMKPELYLSDALGAVGKPMFRVHTAGSVGGTTAIVAASHVQAGKHQHRAWRSPSRSSRRATPSSPWAAARVPRSAAGGAFAPFIRAYIHRSGAPEHIGWKVAVKDRLNALKNPYAHLKIEDISIEKVKNSPMMWEPIRFLESCPSSDGACAVVLTDEAGGKAAAADGRPPAWILGRLVAVRAPELSRAATRCARGVRSSAPPTSTRRPASPTRASRSTWRSSTCRSRGTRPMWLEAHDIADEGEGWKMIDDGATELGGSFPINASRRRPLAATRSAPRVCCGSPRRPTRSGVRPASTRSTGPRWPSAWPTAPTPSTSACGSWRARCIPSTDRLPGSASREVQLPALGRAAPLRFLK